jgi:hypothetical protein
MSLIDPFLPLVTVSFETVHLMASAIGLVMATMRDSIVPT